jgi:tetratricopeptide (TPR) repeat protein
MMKHRYLTVPFLLAMLGGCDDLLTETPESFLAPENFYRTAQDAEAAVLSTYEPLGGGNNVVQYFISVEVGSDEGQVAADPNPNTRMSAALTYDAQSPWVTNPYRQFYLTITRANMALEQIPEVPMNEGRKQVLIGEAKFTRALGYYHLVRLYGAVPLVTTPAEQLQPPQRAPEEAVYQQIFQDAQEAAESLPVAWDESNTGRATRGAALTLLADAHLYRQEWQQAADYAKQVIDLGVYSLFPDYLQAFLPAFENGQEHIFSLQANGPTSPVGSAFAALYFPREVGPNRGGGWGMGAPTLWHYNSYIAGDHRKEVTYRTDWVNLAGEEFNDLHPHVYKFRPTRVTPHTSGDVNRPIYRYAEVLLIYAEALNELNRPAEAVQYLNRIRERARRGTGTENRAEPADYTGSLAQDVLREVIFQERRWELAHENKRWFDLKRRGEQYFMEQIAAHSPQATGLHPSKMLWPIPQSEVDMSGLQQNPGY